MNFCMNLPISSVWMKYVETCVKRERKRFIPNDKPVLCRKCVLVLPTQWHLLSPRTGCACAYHTSGHVTTVTSGHVTSGHAQWSDPPQMRLCPCPYTTCIFHPETQWHLLSPRTFNGLISCSEPFVMYIVFLF
jgi:hypothetical protein